MAKKDHPVNPAPYLEDLDGFFKRERKAIENIVNIQAAKASKENINATPTLPTESLSSSSKQPEDKAKQALGAVDKLQQEAKEISAENEKILSQRRGGPGPR